MDIHRTLIRTNKVGYEVEGGRKNAKAREPDRGRKRKVNANNQTVWPGSLITKQCARECATRNDDTTHGCQPISMNISFQIIRSADIWRYKQINRRGNGICNFPETVPTGRTPLLQVVTTLSGHFCTSPVSLVMFLDKQSL